MTAHDTTLAIHQDRHDAQRELDNADLLLSEDYPERGSRTEAGDLLRAAAWELTKRAGDRRGADPVAVAVAAWLTRDSLIIDANTGETWLSMFECPLAVARAVMDGAR